MFGFSEWWNSPYTSPWSRATVLCMGITVVGIILLLIGGVVDSPETVKASIGLIFIPWGLLIVSRVFSWFVEGS